MLLQLISVIFPTNLWLFVFSVLQMHTISSCLMVVMSHYEFTLNCLLKTLS